MKNCIHQMGSPFIFTCLSILMVACGGSGGAKYGERDAVSSRNAFQATVNESGSLKSPTQKNGKSGWLGEDFSMSGDNPNKGSFSTNCENGGKASGGYSYVESSSSDQEGILVIHSDFSECKSDDGAVIHSGSLDIGMTLANGLFSMQLDGSVNVLAKNSKGELASHNIEFKNFNISLGLPNQSSESDTDLSAAISVQCTGSVVMDGTEKTCEDLMSEEQAPVSDAPVSSDSQTFNSYTFSETVNGLQKVLIVVENANNVKDLEVYVKDTAGNEVFVSGTDQEYEGVQGLFNEQARTFIAQEFSSLNKSDLGNFKDNTDGYLVLQRNFSGSTRVASVKLFIEWENGQTETRTYSIQ